MPLLQGDAGPSTSGRNLQAARSKLCTVVSASAAPAPSPPWCDRFAVTCQRAFDLPKLCSGNFVGPDVRVRPEFSRQVQFLRLRCTYVCSPLQRNYEFRRQLCQTYHFSDAGLRTRGIEEFVLWMSTTCPWVGNPGIPFANINIHILVPFVYPFWNRTLVRLFQGHLWVGSQMAPAALSQGGPRARGRSQLVDELLRGRWCFSWAWVKPARPVRFE